ncbi:hypothetical protein NX862_18440 [Rhodobacter sp. KR11]|jgi:hypothetical protein|uniref:hypothetical protein n=1 Tax=Rhodobacter sp. KR11 TaxID=2974588 RepID=UPI0022226F8A|nr:hypothetical protein [Rhodobacter sp. KR11]MCW1920741.1 hypothetical protein [Rhodobacter sp. KR11]
MCMACGHPQAPGHWTEAGAQSPGARLRARAEAAGVLDRLLRPLGLRVDDCHPVPGYRLAHVTGAVLIVQTPEDLWQGVESLLGRPYDPLHD